MTDVAAADSETAPWNIFSPLAVKADAEVISIEPARYLKPLAAVSATADIIEDALANRVPV